MDPRDYLSVALQRLDLLLHREILRLRANYQLSLDEFRGLYISDEQVNQLINRAVNYEGPSSAIDEQFLVNQLVNRAVDYRGASSALMTDAKRRVASRRANKDRRFALAHAGHGILAVSCIEQDILLLAVAPEIDLKYETLFAYLNNDITRKWPTFDLALRIERCLAARRSEVRRCLLPEAKLFRQRIAATSAQLPDRRAMAGDGFFGGPAVCQYLCELFLTRSAVGFVCRTADAIG